MNRRESEMGNERSKAVPIRTVEEYDSAVSAGARIEFTALSSDGYDMPPHDKPGSGGWIEPRLIGVDSWLRPALSHGGSPRLRAFYPVPPPTPTFWQRLARLFRTGAQS